MSCRGDRYHALVGNDEIIFSVPTPNVEGLLTVLRHVEKYGSRLPRNPQMSREPEFQESYRNILKMLGCE
jgi:hypothetical protein